MAKASSPKSASRSKAASKSAITAPRPIRKAAKAATVIKTVPVNAQSPDQPVKQRAGTKQDQVLDMLMKPPGATIDAIMKATGWQAHSVRGFFAGVVRKKLKLTLTSEAGDGDRVYKVTCNSSAAISGLKSTKAAA